MNSVGKNNNLSDCKLKRVYHQYHLWEDYINGMYNDSNVLDKDILVIKSIEMFKSVELFYTIMKSLIIDWPISSENNLTNSNQNRRAWLGAAACSYNHKCPEYLTRVSWGLLNYDVQVKANNVADTIIKEYEAKNKKIHIGLGGQMLF